MLFDVMLRCHVRFAETFGQHIEDEISADPFNMTEVPALINQVQYCYHVQMVRHTHTYTERAAERLGSYFETK